jgi:hypothetical protein
MTAIVLPDIDRATLEELKKRIPSLSEIEMPSMETAGKKADQTIDRLLRRSRPSAWPWIAAGVFVVALIGTVAAFFTWNRRASWARETDPWAEDAAVPTMSTDASSDLSGITATEPAMGGGLTAAETSLTSTGGYEDQTS